jgi:hypothetical protein
VKSSTTTAAISLIDGSKVCYEVPQEDIVLGDDIVFTNSLPGVSPVCKFDPERPYIAVFNVLWLLQDVWQWGMGPIAVSFVPSSDAATLAVDSIASNG